MTLTATYSKKQLVGDVDVLAEGALEKTIESIKPDIVINCIGIIKQRKEAENRYLSIGINSWLPHKIARLCAENGARLIHLSTDCVFDGTRGGYREDELTNATDLYGRSKALGETDKTEKNAVTLRTSIIGRELAEPKQSLIEWFLSQQGKTIKGFERAIYTGFTTHEMARIIVRVIDTPDLYGLFHVASAPINKYDLLVMLREQMSLDIDIVRDSEFHCDRSLVMDRFTEKTGYKAPSWQEMLEEMAADKTIYK